MWSGEQEEEEEEDSEAVEVLSDCLGVLRLLVFSSADSRVEEALDTVNWHVSLSPRREWAVGRKEG